ncbi:unnamed protein product [Amoebophrya sp. A120]|nr:unnamed protein product [Amoebophrya sp. A120]CAD7973055.1 unnamed protein product [Amoebophrya sp. A120]
MCPSADDRARVERATARLRQTDRKPSEDAPAEPASSNWEDLYDDQELDDLTSGWYGVALSIRRSGKID